MCIVSRVDRFRVVDGDGSELVCTWDELSLFLGESVE